MEKKSKRPRSENWLEDDKNLLQELVRDRVSVIENKNTDTNTNQAKKRKWDEVLESFNSLCKGGQRTLIQLKTQWGCIKMLRKREVAEYRKSISRTGGGPPPPAPTVDSQDITSWLPEEFTVDSNPYDSDNVQKLPDEPESQYQVICEEVPDENIVIIPEGPDVSSDHHAIEIPGTQEPKLVKKKPKTNIAEQQINKIAEQELKNKNELHQLQMENERRKARNLDLEYLILKEKLAYFKNKPK